MSAKPSLFAELKRRNVIRMAGLYLVGAWLITQVASTVFPAFDVPGWALRALIIVLAIGFVPALVFSWAFEITPQGIKRESEVEAHESITRRTGRKIDFAIIAALTLALVVLALDRFVFEPNRATSGHGESAVAAAEGNSIAVLPLANASGDQGQQYFSDGLSENLIVALSQFHGLRVIGRNSAFQFRDSKESSKTIGAKLGVAHLIEGSVQRAGDTVRISAELINAADGSTLWSQRYDRPFKDLFALQDEITTAVAAALKTRLLPNEAGAAQSDRPPGGNLDAYNAYLQGKFYGERNTEADMHKAIEQFTTATRLDPRYAQAWAQLSGYWTGLATTFLEGAAEQAAFGQARTTIDTALAAAPELAFAHVAKGLLLQSADFDWRGAEAQYHRATELAPDDGEANFELGRLLAVFGHSERGVELTRKALGTDPLNARWHDWLAIHYTALGRLDDAEASVRKAIELQPGAASYHWTLAIIAVLRGDAAAALEAARAEVPGVWQDQALALALQIGPDRSAADAALKTLIEKHAIGSPYQIAQTYALRNDADQTFAWLDRALDNRDAGIQYLLFDPFIRRFKSDSPYAAFCRKVRLPTPEEVATSSAATGNTKPTGPNGSDASPAEPTPERKP